MEKSEPRLIIAVIVFCLAVITNVVLLAYSARLLDQIQECKECPEQ